MKLKELISNGKLDEVFAVLLDMIPKFKSYNSKTNIDTVFDDLIKIKYRYTRTKKNEQSGTSDESNINKEFNRIVNSLIDIIAQIPEEFCNYVENLNKLYESDKLLNSVEKIDIINTLNSIDFYPTLTEIDKYRENIAMFSLQAHKVFLKKTGLYFRQTSPSRVDDEYILCIEALLHKIFLQVQNQTTENAFTETLNLTIGYTSFLASRINTDNKDSSFFKEILQLGTALYSI